MRSDASQANNRRVAAVELLPEKKENINILAEKNFAGRQCSAGRLWFWLSVCVWNHELRLRLREEHARLQFRDPIQMDRQIAGCARQH